MTKIKDMTQGKPLPLIIQFALPLMVGIVAGLFSSVCLAGNLWNFYRKRFVKKA